MGKTGLNIRAALSEWVGPADIFSLLMKSLHPWFGLDSKVHKICVEFPAKSPVFPIDTIKTDQQVL